MPVSQPPFRHLRGGQTTLGVKALPFAPLIFFPPARRWTVSLDDAAGVAESAPGPARRSGDPHCQKEITMFRALDCARARRTPSPIQFAFAAAAGIFSGAFADDAPSLTHDENGSSLMTVTGAPNFDLSVTHTIEDGSGTLKTELHHHANGKLTGGSTHTESGGFESEMQLAGAVKGSNGKATVKTKATSYIKIDGELDSTAKQASKGTVTPDGTYSGVLKTRFCSEYVGCKSFSTPFSSQLGSGDWSIQLTLDGEGRKVFGAVSITTSVQRPEERRVFDYVASGKFAPKTGVATLRLVSAGDPELPPLKLKARMTPSGGIDPWSLDAVLQISGKLLGQKIALKLADPALRKATAN
jgi:hypothetical protein